MRLIDADALKETVRTHDYILKDCFNSIDKGMFTLGIMYAIDEQPTIDAAQVIRCIDCKHNVANKKIDPLDITDYSGEDIVCDYFMTDGLNSKDYCSYAERKEE